MWKANHMETPKYEHPEVPEVDQCPARAGKQ
jgi:hypothetical protein